MPLTKHQMEGEGELGEWLKQTGREVARAAGNELKSVANGFLRACRPSSCRAAAAAASSACAGAIWAASSAGARGFGNVHKPLSLLVL